MRRAVVITLAVVSMVACGGYGNEARTTTTGAPMITSGPPAGETELSRTVESTAQRLAIEVCNHEAKCGRAEMEQCLGATVSRARAQLASWRCDPAGVRARFEECLAGIDEQPCGIRLESEPRWCPPNPVCGGARANLISPGRVIAEIWR